MDIRISTSPILPIDDGVRSHIIRPVDFINAEAVESTRWLRYIRSTRLKLSRRCMGNRESTIVVRDVLVPVVAALSESLLETISFIEEDGFEMT